ncbi:MULTISPECIES: ABC transporter permease [unclassified Frondihabitans]|uniref:ABC transporter permease n=1 Tax=unclassified Frondihabitans TaxID=2626248 RepID=UPI000F4E41A2|nr:MULTISPECIES: ABC transporter permease [unclassified Frondihabitans]RPE74503.1 peptide/nickel transport system permease protein [Frondihabitans sp. PhB153]RPF02932.1 peptide/nickel transport system permease protein [Frondihabitans sp. PhB161]
MIRFVLSRLVLLVVGLAAASALIFFTLRLLTGDVAQVIAGTQGTAEQVAAIRSSLGLDRPLPVQYADWILGLLHGDLGRSIVTGSSVASQLGQKLAVTLPLAGLSLVIGLVVGIPLGVVSAIRHRRPSGTAISVVAQAIAAIPAVWGAMILIAVFAVTLKLLPTQGFPSDGWQDPARALRSLLLPALTIGLIEGAVLLRFTRSATLGALNEDYVRTAASKGMTRTQAVVRHGLPNVLLSVVSVLGVQLAALLVGAVLVEQLFALPGIGRMLVSDVGVRDLPKVQGELLALTGLVLILGFVVDLVHRAVDPRLREPGE